MTFHKLIVTLGLAVGCVVSTFAQNMGNSPYSIYGIGDRNSGGHIRNIGMAGVGVSTGHVEFINILNPALLPVNKGDNKDSTLKFTMMDVSLNGIGRTLTQGKETQSSGGVNMSYFSLMLPLSKKWSTAVGLLPYSSIYNRYQQQDFIEGSDTIKKVVDYSSKGSINQVYLSNGLDISKSLSIGLHLGYLFGNVVTRNVATFQLPQSSFSSQKGGAQYNDFHQSFEIKTGLAYRKELSKDSSSTGKGIFVNAGATFSQLVGGTNTRSTSLVFVNLLDGLSLVNDTLPKTKQTLVLPSTGAIGLSIDRPGKWTIAADFTYTNWSVYKDISGNKLLSDSYVIALGGEWKPVKNLSLRSKEYRAGISYTKTPLTFNGKQLEDVSVSLGSTLPIGRKDARFKSKPLSKINLALVLGTRGTTSNNLVKEQYFKIYFGILIHDKWFQRWKID